MKPTRKCEIKLVDVERAVEVERDAWAEAVEQVLTDFHENDMRDMLVEQIAKRVERNRLLLKGRQS